MKTKLLIAYIIFAIPTVAIVTLVGWVLIATIGWKVSLGFVILISMFLWAADVIDNE